MFNIFNKIILISIIFNSIIVQCQDKTTTTSPQSACPKKMENLFLIYQSRDLKDVHESYALYEVSEDVERFVMQLPIPRSYRLTSTEIDDSALILYASFVEDDSKSTDLLKIHLDQLTWTIYKYEFRVCCLQLTASGKLLAFRTDEHKQELHHLTMKNNYTSDVIWKWTQKNYYVGEQGRRLSAYSHLLKIYYVVLEDTFTNRDYLFSVPMTERTVLFDDDDKPVFRAGNATKALLLSDQNHQLMSLDFSNRSKLFSYVRSGLNPNFKFKLYELDFSSPPFTNYIPISEEPINGTMMGEMEATFSERSHVYFVALKTGVVVAYSTLSTNVICHQWKLKDLGTNPLVALRTGFVDAVGTLVRNKTAADKSNQTYLLIVQASVVVVVVIFLAIMYRRWKSKSSTSDSNKQK